MSLKTIDHGVCFNKIHGLSRCPIPRQHVTAFRTADYEVFTPETRVLYLKMAATFHQHIGSNDQRLMGQENY